MIVPRVALGKTVLALALILIQLGCVTVTLNPHTDRLRQYRSLRRSTR